MHSANSLLKVSAYSMLLNLQDKFLEMSQCNFHGQVLGFSAKSIVQSNSNIQCKVYNYKIFSLVQIPYIKSSSVKCELLSLIQCKFSNWGKMTLVQSTQSNKGSENSLKSLVQSIQCKILSAYSVKHQKFQFSAISVVQSGCFRHQCHGHSS